MNIRVSIRNIVLFGGIVLILAAQGCHLTDFPVNERSSTKDTSVSVSITKWYNNHSAAISITNDGNWWSAAQKQAQKFVLAHNMTMGYEVVTSAWEKNMNSVHFFMDSLASRGFGYYGHGHHHVNHDSMTYAEDYVDFKTCYDTMIAFGMKPVAYAYPGGFGWHIATQNAVRDAGFLSARMFEKLDFLNPFILPGDRKEPKNWYQLPTLIMQSIDYDGCVICVNNTQDLIPYLDECINETAWLIITYHAINNTSEFGYYFLSDMLKDLAAIHQRDFWVSSMNKITLYIRERAKAMASAVWIRNNYGLVDSIKININDNLPGNIYDQPLTAMFNIPSYWVNNKVYLVENKNVKDQFNFYTNKVMVSLLPSNTTYYLTLDK